MSDEKVTIHAEYWEQHGAAVIEATRQLDRVIEYLLDDFPEEDQPLTSSFQVVLDGLLLARAALTRALMPWII